jgi:hypothetical protein
MNRSGYILIIFCAIFCGTGGWGQSLIPEPQKVIRKSSRVFHFREPEKQLTIRIDTALGLPTDEGYILDIQKNRILIEARSQRGVTWAKQTLKQLQVTDHKGYLLPDVRIEDYPVFPLRGFMLDTGRNFMELPLLKHYLDILAIYKINVFHWHLTDNPGWRIECRAYPQLNDPKHGVTGRDEGRFYTYDEIRELIRYARDRGIQVIPEIDMPGHSAYFEKAFGFRMETAEGKKVLEKCLAEFFSEIPATDCPYFHIGSDEVHVPDPAGFMRFVEEIVEKAGRRPVAWDPGLPGSPGTIRQIWLEGARIPKRDTDSSRDFIDSYLGYLNYFDPIVFTYRIMLHDTRRIASTYLGGILCLWNDVRVADKEKIAVHNGFLNGLLPFSERFWTARPVDFEGDPNLLPPPESPAGKYIAAFEERMQQHKNGVLAGEKFYWHPSASLSWKISTPLDPGTDTAGVAWHPAWGGSIDMGSFASALKIKEKAGLFSFAKTSIYAASDTTIRAWVGFEAAARSNRISGGIGKEGEWENQGEIRVNGEKIAPPRWQEPGAYAFNFATWSRPEELLPYTDEQFYWMRDSVEIRLKKGWNQVEVKTIKTFPGQRWSFAFIPFLPKPQD